MIALGLTVWLGAMAVAGGAIVDVSAGVLAPLAVACVAWVLMERTFLKRPEALTTLMIAAFAFKIVFFGAYVAFGLRVAGLAVRPFVGSLAAAFIALHMVEAYFLSALFKRRASAGS
jgi:hypothetical protein